MAMCYARGLTVADFEVCTIGMLINYCHEYDRMKLKSQGKTVIDPEERYHQLKGIEQQVDDKFARGEISKEKYMKYKQSLAEWECD